MGAFYFWDLLFLLSILFIYNISNSNCITRLIKFSSNISLHIYESSLNFLISNCLYDSNNMFTFVLHTQIDVTKYELSQLDSACEKRGLGKNEPRLGTHGWWI
ncbi:hypothetical protein CHH48_01475 [Terribacillus saccharophilus]|uniref:Uncharacterized protein n=1 Tax=Terribacillus saccharophilus TaxID=361277 RepID=A0ABX4H2S2_9BACI|nr:hypothetical protein CHH56_00780 [Terribacillus saccharophilus]PAD97399.1 hypothetical protein CHH50_01485 [Terribacillus saccharophilus]PAE01447.1 hypothetical protein CHH48_01475 [Terribacillus saccharophilus]